MVRGKLVDFGRVARGRVGELAILTAFVHCEGEVEVEIEIGTIAGSGETYVLVMVDGVRAVFRPLELQAMGERIIAQLPSAKAFGASPSDINDLRGFATLLIDNAKGAATMSPHGMH